MRDTGFAHKKCSPYLDAVHKVEALWFCMFCRRQTNSTCIINKNINAAKCFYGFTNGSLDLVFKTNITL